jgi:hypothetical protein
MLLVVLPASQTLPDFCFVIRGVQTLEKRAIHSVPIMSPEAAVGTQSGVERWHTAYSLRYRRNIEIGGQMRHHRS